MIKLVEVRNADGVWEPWDTRDESCLLGGELEADDKADICLIAECGSADVRCERLLRAVQGEPLFKVLIQVNGRWETYRSGLTWADAETYSEDLGSYYLPRVLPEGL
jgi:hypothetical protein